MRTTWTILLAVAVLAAGPAAAQTTAPTVVTLGQSRGQVIVSWDEFVKITGYDPAKKGLQVLTIPWAEVEKLLGVDKIERVGDGATVDLPWKEFQALLEWSIQKKGKPDLPPPTDFIITSSLYEGALAPDGADFRLKLKINVLRQKGWKRIPVLPATVALIGAALPEGVFLNSTGGAYELLTEQAGPIEATIDFAVAVQKSAGINQVHFQPVQPYSSLLDLVVDEKDVKADVKVAGAQSLTSKTVDAKVHHLAALPVGAQVSISWERALPKVEPVPTKLYAETRTLVAVAEGVLLCQEVVNFNILHTPVREFKLNVPPDCSVLTVTGPNVQDWRVSDKGELLVVLRAEVIGSYSLRLTFERAAPKETVEAPVVRAAGVEREKGFVAVIAVANVEIAPGAVTGATGIDVRQLPADILAMTNQPVLLAFRYMAQAFSIPLTIKKHGEVGVLVTVVDTGMFTAMQLNDGRRITKVLYSVRNNRNQFLRMVLPEGADIWSASVSGNTVSPARDEKGNVLIPLVRSSASAAELASFPVEMVYVETPAEVAPEKGKVRVELPTLDTPVIHEMFSYYLPEEGEYKVPVGLFGSKPGFTGPMTLVDEFTSLAAGPGAEVIRRDAARQAAQMQQEVDVQVDAAARVSGATPIRVQLPITGKLFKLEKILALPQDKLWFEVQYSGWKVAK